MTKKEAKTLFLDDVIGDELLVVKRDEQGRPVEVVQIDIFLNLFQNVPFQYTSLIEKDAGKMGYKHIIERAKKEGVLN